MLAKYLFKGAVMFKKILCCGSLVFLAGCMAVSPVKINGPSGKAAYSMKCSGMGRTLEDCYLKAGEICPNGYVIVDRASGYAQIGSIGAMQHSLVIECK